MQYVITQPRAVFDGHRGDGEGYVLHPSPVGSSDVSIFPFENISSTVVIHQAASPCPVPGGILFSLLAIVKYSYYS